MDADNETMFERWGGSSGANVDFNTVDHETMVVGVACSNAIWIKRFDDFRDKQISRVASLVCPMDVPLALVFRKFQQKLYLFKIGRKIDS